MIVNIMELFIFCIILLIILFLMVFCYQVLIQKNKIIGYQTIKNYNDADYDLNDINNKYHRNSCDDYCHLDICNQYEIQMENFKKCVSCSKKLKCHNIFTDTCENCLSMGLGSCKMPLNPRNNFCKNS